MITLVWRTDVHLSDQNPQSRTDDWAETVLGKLKQVGDIAKVLDAQAVLDGGDFFHIKSPRRNSHELIQRVARIHQEYPCPVYGCVGNHDLKYGDMRFLPESPLGVLFETGVFKRLYDKHEAVFESDGVKVRVVGVPYHGTQYEMDRFHNIKKGDEDHLVVVGHVLASKQGGSMFENEDIISYKDLVDVPASAFCFGHWHKDQGITEIAPGKFVVNVGSLTRGALNQDDLGRVPCAVSMSFTKGGVEIKRHPLKVGDPSEVFDLDGRKAMETRSAAMEEFVENLQNTLTRSDKPPLEDVLRGLDIPENVREQALLYLEAAG